MYWSNGYCRLHKQETNDGASCDKAIGGILGFRCKYFFIDEENNSQNNDYFFKKERKNDEINKNNGTSNDYCYNCVMFDGLQ